MICELLTILRLATIQQCELLQQWTSPVGGWPWTPSGQKLSNKWAPWAVFKLPIPVHITLTVTLQYLAGVTVPASRSPTPSSIQFNRDGSLRHVELKASGFLEERKLGVYHLKM